jgi:hypothetical protein
MKITVETFGTDGRLDKTFTVNSHSWEDTLKDVLPMMDGLLKSAGFYYSGYLDIVEGDE